MAHNTITRDRQTVKYLKQLTINNYCTISWTIHAIPLEQF